MGADKPRGARDGDVRVDKARGFEDLERVAGAWEPSWSHTGRSLEPPRPGRAGAAVEATGAGWYWARGRCWREGWRDGGDSPGKGGCSCCG